MTDQDIPNERAGTQYKSPQGFDHLLWLIQSIPSRARPVTLLANALPGTTPGIDISHWNGVLTKDWWSAAYDEGYRFVFLKATDGRSFKDPNFEANKANAREAGFKVGAYCFARPRSSGIEQAEFFISVAGELDLGGVWDLEDDGGMVDWVINNRTEEFLSTLNSHYGYSWMYSASWFLDPRQINPQVPYYRWVAHWTSATSPFLPRIWRDREYDAWQYNSRETVAGKSPVDVNRMQRTLYEKLIGDNDDHDDLVNLRVKQETIDDLKRALEEH